jgi:hypothetical protein
MLAVAFVLERMGSLGNAVHVGKKHARYNQNDMDTDFPCNGLISL